ncbi:MAG: methyltransferase [Pseudomonadota bacterium]
MAKTQLMISAGLALVLAACGSETTEAPTGTAETVVEETAEAAEETVAEEVVEQRTLASVLENQSEEVKARYPFRNPQATLEFFEVEPGETVVDTLPGEVWYAGILSEYLGSEGKVIGADYSVDMWRLFKGFVDEEYLTRKATWTETWVADMEENSEDGDAPFGAVVYGSVDEAHTGVADTVLMVRAVHHFNRLEDEGQYFSGALSDAMTMLKPGGILGIVQHRGPEGNDDAWAEGDNGYVKQSTVVSMAEAAGFELVEASEINANPKDQPTNEDVVWRLPPSLATSREDAELKAQMEAIGESDRMTLKFRKPA